VILRLLLFLKLLLPFRRIARREDQEFEQGNVFTSAPLPASFPCCKPICSAPPRARFPPQLDGRLLQTIHPFTEGESAAKTEQRWRDLSGLCPKRVHPQSQPTKKTCDRPNLFPAGMIRALFSAPKIVGLWGRTHVPHADTPSLNPGLWYNWYPPIAGRRQAKKTRKVWKLGPNLFLLAFEDQALLASLLYVRGFLRTGCYASQLSRVLK
jgi:hypothetical protein